MRSLHQPTEAMMIDRIDAIAVMSHALGFDKMTLVVNPEQWEEFCATLGYDPDVECYTECFADDGDRTTVQVEVLG